tara:strand:+ start:248 stop:1084 length:837 start_codon:yes stop_codon:yes gene_type:complete
MSIAYLNGSWQPLEEARVSVLDRGFMFGDGVYEVIPVYQGKPFAEDEHLARLATSLKELHIMMPRSEDDWQELFREAIDRGDEDEAILYVQVTRGVAESRSHIYEDSEPTVLITLSPRVTPGLDHKLSVVTKEDFRWARGHIKVISLAANSLAKNEAIAEGYDDAILVRDGKVTEASSSNVFIVKDSVIVTPIADNHLLHGITRAQVIALAKQHDLPFEERDISEDELLAADEVWVTATSIEVWPVHKVNNQWIGNGEVGLVYQKVYNLFQELKCQSN